MMINYHVAVIYQSIYVRSLLVNQYGTIITAHVATVSYTHLTLPTILRV